MLLTEWYSSRHRTARNALADAQNCQPAKEESSCFSFAWRTLFICRKRCWVCRGKDEGGRGRSSVRPCGGGGRNSVRPWVYFFSSKAQGFGARALGFPAEWRGGLADLSSLEKPCVLFLCFFWQVRKSAFVFSARCVGPLEGKPPRYHQDEKARSFNPPSACPLDDPRPPPPASLRPLAVCFVRLGGSSQAL